MARNPRANGLCFGQGGLDSLMLDQAANLIGKEGFAMLGGAAELDRLFLVSHGIRPNE